MNELRNAPAPVATGTTRATIPARTAVLIPTRAPVPAPASVPAIYAPVPAHTSVPETYAPVPAHTPVPVDATPLFPINVDSPATLPTPRALHKRSNGKQRRSSQADLPDTSRARHGENLTTYLSFSKSLASSTGVFFDAGSLRDGVGGGRKGGINMRGTDSIDLLDECSKQAASMWGRFEELMPTKEHKEEKEKAERKSVVCTLLNSLLETKNRLRAANIDTSMIDREIENTITKLAF